MKKVLATFIVFCISITSLLWSNESQLGKRIYVTTRIDSLLPVIDGRLDDPCWKGENWAGDFVQRSPYEGESATEKTAFKVLYDDNNLYVAIRAFDTEPDKIARWAGRRDGQTGDIVGIAIDSYFDHRTGFEFNLTAAGVKSDAVLSDTETRYTFDTNWDAVWFGKVAMEDSAWTAEMRIPFSQLRFAEKDEHIWGIHVWRMIHRKHEDVNWTRKPRDAPGIVRFFGEMHGIKGIKMPLRIELLPYTGGKLSTFQSEQGNPFATGRSSNLGGGFDGKVGVTSDLTLDFTVNPDFGQVEADPSVMNLTAFETFFTEKRPFFMEGKKILDFKLDSDLLFHSRRIGHSPSYHPSTETDEYVKMPENTSIISALKLTGKNRNGLSIGVVESITAEEKAQIYHEGLYRSQTVEPLSNYFVGRFQKDYDEGNTIIGGMFTATNRILSAEHLEFLNRSAYNGGFDFMYQWNDKSYYLNIKTIFSHVRGSQQALTKVQRASSHYFQRPDADHVSLDSTRTDLSGHGGIIEGGRGGNSNWRFSEGVSWRSPGLELNDMGYLRIADIIKQNTTLGYFVTKPIGIFRSYSFSLKQYSHWNFGGEKLPAGGSISLKANFTNLWGVSSNVSREMASLNTRILRGGPALKSQGNWNYSYSLSSNRRKILSFTFNGSNIWSDDGVSRFYRFQPSISLRASNALGLSANFSYSFNRDDLQYVTTRIVNEENRYIFARINQKTLGITVRFNYSLTPELTIQYYGRPYVSAGKYSHFKKITNPRADHYSDRFHTFSEHEISYEEAEKKYLIDEDQDGDTDYFIGRPDFSFRQFSSNLVIRWEYKAGSTLYLVWSQGRTGRTGYESSGKFSFIDDLQELYEIYPHDIFLIKFSHWFSL